MNTKAIVAAAAALAVVGAGSAVLLTRGPAKPGKPCVRAPLDGGTDCLRAGFAPDGGPGFFGTGNVFPATQAAGSNCDQVECSVLYGEDPDKSL